MKLLHDSIYDPLKQTKRTLWCFDRLIINSVSGCFRRFGEKFLKQTERLKRCIRLFSWLENSRRKFGFHVFKPFLNICFRLSRPFLVMRNWLRPMVNAITERNPNSSVVNSVHHLPKPWSDWFTHVNSRKALCPKSWDTASSHRYLSLGASISSKSGETRVYRRICVIYSRLPIIRTFKGNRKKFELSGVRVIEGKVI